LKKILIIRFSSIGDIVLTTPVIRCIKEQLPGVELHYLTKEEYKPLLLNNPYIDKIHTIKKDLKEILPDLKKEKFDYIIDLHKNIRSLFIKLSLIGIPSRTFKKLTFKKWLLIKFKINVMPSIHIVDRYLNTAKFLNIFNDNKGLDYFIDEKDIVNLNELPEAFRNEYVAIVLGSKHNTKQLPTDKLISLCQKIKTPMILIGSKEDKEKGELIKKSAESKIFNACGIYNINQSASLVQQAKIVITPDTGLMHIAAAFQKKIISIWGNTVPAFGMYPYLPEEIKNRSVIIETNGLLCRPCSRLGYKTCPEKHFNCMNRINENTIAEIVNS